MDLNEKTNTKPVADAEDSLDVEDFIRELEAKEKDLHITSDTTFIEIDGDDTDTELPDYLLNDLAEVGPKTVREADVKRPAADAKLEKEVASLKAKIAALEAERTENLKTSLRRSRDFEAYKSRTERERGESFESQICKIAFKLLPAIDNLERALNFASEVQDTKKNKKLTQFFDGIVLVNEQIIDVMASLGVKAIDAVGQPFDPRYHEAVAVESVAGFPPDTVSEELLRGYRVGEKVIRHSMVKVSKPDNGAASDPDGALSDDDSPEIETFVSNDDIDPVTQAAEHIEGLEVFSRDTEETPLATTDT